MKKLFKQISHVKLLTFCLVSLGLVVSSQADDPDKLPTAEKVMMKFTEMSGGIDKFKAIKSITMKGKLIIPGVITGDLEVVQVMPNKVYTKAVLPGAGTETQVSNGKHAWHLSDASGSRLLKGKEMEQLQEGANLDRFTDPMNFYKEIKVIGIEDVEGEKCFKVNITKKSGDEMVEYFSVKTGMQVKSEVEFVMQAGKMNVASFVKEYKDVDGIKLPAKTELMVAGSKRMFEFESIEINKEVDEKLFEVPADIKQLMEAEMKDEKGKDSDG